MNPNPVFKVRPFFDAKYITNGYRYGHSYYYRLVVALINNVGVQASKYQYRGLLNILKFAAWRLVVAFINIGRPRPMVL